MTSNFNIRAASKDAPNREGTGTGRPGAARKPEPFNDLNIDSVDGQNAPVAGIRIGCTFCECEIRNPIVREDSIECPTCGTGLIAWGGAA